ncbi:MAG TPA: hypothetical protein VK540_35595 [Polyangiaceae bacterium]|nr:hypothetical protein [Polyangiaceae bacterium]
MGSETEHDHTAEWYHENLDVFAEENDKPRRDVEELRVERDEAEESYEAQLETADKLRAENAALNKDYAALVKEHSREVGEVKAENARLMEAIVCALALLRGDRSFVADAVSTLRDALKGKGT